MSGNGTLHLFAGVTGQPEVCCESHIMSAFKSERGRPAKNLRDARSAQDFMFPQKTMSVVEVEACIECIASRCHTQPAQIKRLHEARLFLTFRL